jgi:hypothetical protein
MQAREGLDNVLNIDSLSSDGENDMSTEQEGEMNFKASQLKHKRK